MKKKNKFKMPTLVVIIMDLKPLQQVCGLNWCVQAVVYEKTTKHHAKRCEWRVMNLPLFGSPDNLKSNRYLNHEAETLPH